MAIPPLDNVIAKRNITYRRSEYVPRGFDGQPFRLTPLIFHNISELWWMYPRFYPRWSARSPRAKPTAMPRGKTGGGVGVTPG